jgi:signal transduction histidine kinase
MTVVTSSAGRSPIPSTLVRLSVGLACALLGVLIELGLDQVVAVAPWLIVSFAVGLLAAILGGLLGGVVAAIVGTAAQAVVIPAWVPAAGTLDGADWQIHAAAALVALVVGLWIRQLILRPRRKSVAEPADGSVGGDGPETGLPWHTADADRAGRSGGAISAGARAARAPTGGRAPGPDPASVASLAAADEASPSARPDHGPAATAADLEVVADAVRDFAVARTPAQVADSLARHATALSGAAGAIVYLGRDGADGLVPLGRHGAADPTAPERLAADPDPSNPTGPARGTRRRPGASPYGFARPAPGHAMSGNGRVVDCEIRSGAGMVGVLRLSGAPDGPRPRPGRLVEVLVAVAADTLGRGRLESSWRAAEAEAAGAVGRVGILARLAAALVRATTVEGVARTLVDLAVDDLGAGFAVVHVPEPGSGVYRLAHARGYPAGLHAREASIDPASVTPVTRAALDRSIVQVVGEDGWREAFPAASNVPAITGVGAITAIPMQAAGAVQGVLTIGWRTRPDPTVGARDLLTIAADQGAQALERAVLHAHDEDARRFQEAFIGVVSHELRTPITTILAGSRLLSRRLEGDPRAAELSDDIAVEADRLSRIVDDLLVLSRLERRHLTVGDEPVHLDHLLTRILRSEATRWPDHRFEVRPSRGSHVVIGDETYVEQVLHNLISNAAKYSPLGSLVEIAIDDAPGGDVDVRVLDEGPGVAPAEVDELFSLFYRSPATAASAAGAGIGLFVSRRLVAEMGGRMWARPRAGAGSEFGFSLGRYPIDEAELDGPLPGAAAAAGD